MFKIFKPNKRRFQLKESPSSRQVPSSMPHRTCGFDFSQSAQSRQKASRKQNIPYSALQSESNRIVNSTTSRGLNSNRIVNSSNIFSVLKKNMSSKVKIYSSQKSLRKRQSSNRGQRLSKQNFFSIDKTFNDPKLTTNIKKNDDLSSKTLREWNLKMLKEKQLNSSKSSRKYLQRTTSKNNIHEAKLAQKIKDQIHDKNRSSINSKPSFQEFNSASRVDAQYCTILLQLGSERQFKVKYKVKRIGALIQFLKNYLEQHKSFIPDRSQANSKKYKEITTFQTIERSLQVDYFLTLEDQDGSFFNGKTLALRPLYSIKQPVITLNSFQIIQCIGSGGFSFVFLCRFKQNHKFYAMKLVSKPFIVQNQKKKIIMNERNIMVELRDKINLAKLFFSFQAKQYLVFVMEYYEGGQLFNLVKKFRKMNEPTARFYITQVLIGLEQIHDHNIVYRDFKPENIMIDREGHAYIADFGLAKPSISTCTDRAYSFCGSPQYMPPEMILKDGHSLPVDFYCLGALLYELITGLPPFYSTDPQIIYEATLTEQLTFPDHVNISNELEDLLIGLLWKDQSHRIGSTFGVQQVLSHPWFKSITKQDFASKKVNPPVNFKSIQDLRFNVDQLQEQNHAKLQQTLKNQKNQLSSRYLKIMNGFYYDYRVQETPHESGQQMKAKKDFKKQKTRMSTEKIKNSSSSLALTNCTKRSQNSLILGGKPDQSLRIFIKQKPDKQNNARYKTNIYSQKQSTPGKQQKSVQKRLLKNLNNFIF